MDPRRASQVDAAAVTCPLLVIAGSEDRITPARVARRVARKYGALATFRLLDEHAHWLVAEPGWQVVAQHVADGLQQLPAPIERAPGPDCRTHQ